MILGQHDDEMMKSEIADGLTEEDLITYPEEGTGGRYAYSQGRQRSDGGQSNPQLSEEEMMEDGTDACRRRDAG